jgi:hypothetical protein
MTSPWYRQIFSTRLAPNRQAVQEFITTRQGYRLATSTGGVLTGRGADIMLIDLDTAAQPPPVEIEPPRVAIDLDRDTVLSAGGQHALDVLGRRSSWRPVI